MDKSEDSSKMTWKKSLIVQIGTGGISKKAIDGTVEEIFGKGSTQEIEDVNVKEKHFERIEDLSKRDEQFEE